MWLNGGGGKSAEKVRITPPAATPIYVIFFCFNPLVPMDFFSKKFFLGPPTLSAVKKFLVQIFDRFWSHLKDFEHRFQIFKKSKKIGKKSVVKKVGSSS